MTMENELAKRGWIAELWRETEHDEAARDLLFGEILENFKDEIVDRLGDTLKAEIEDEVKDRWTDEPPDSVRQKLIKEFADDPPDEIRVALKEELRELICADFQDRIDDLTTEKARLEERLDDYKAEFAAYKKKYGSKDTQP